MQYIGYALYALAALYTLTFIVGIRTYTLRGTPPMKPTVNQTMLFVASLAIIPFAKLSPLHLLWMMPASYVIGMLSIAMPFSLLSIPGGLFYRLACLGVDFEKAERNRVRLQKLQDLVAEEGLSAEQARDKLVERGEW